MSLIQMLVEPEPLQLTKCAVTVTGAHTAVLLRQSMAAHV